MTHNISSMFLKAVSFLFLASLTLLSGCKPGCCCTFNLPVLCHGEPGRRPPVAVYKSPEIKEYFFEDIDLNKNSNTPYYKGCCEDPRDLNRDKPSEENETCIIHCETPCDPSDDYYSSECLPIENESRMPCEKLSLDSCEESDDEPENEDLTDLLDRNQPLIKEYIIAVGDVLEISVFGDEDTHVDNVIVAPDGRIYYLFLNGMIAEGKTTEQLKKDLESSLASMFLSPTVSIIPRNMTNNNFTILGRVRRPGSYPLFQTVTVRQALGLAGGLILEPELITSSDQPSRFFLQSNRSRFLIQPISGYSQNLSSLKDSFLVRNGKKINIDFKHLVYSGDITQDIIIKPGDYIYIASDDRKEVFVLGAVAGPMAIPYEDDITLMKALARAGGWRAGGPSGADYQNVMILRGSLQCPKVLRVDLCDFINGKALDIYLEPGDIVYLHNKKFRFGRELVRLAVTSFIYSFLNEAGTYFANQHIH